MDSTIFAAQFQDDFARFVDKQIEFHDKLIKTLDSMLNKSSTNPVNETNYEDPEREFESKIAENVQQPRIVDPKPKEVIVANFTQDAIDQLIGLLGMSKADIEFSKLRDWENKNKKGSDSGFISMLVSGLGSFLLKPLSLIGSGLSKLLTFLGGPLLRSLPALGTSLVPILTNIGRIFAVGGPFLLALGSIAASITDIFQWFNSTDEEREAREKKMQKEFSQEFERIQEGGFSYIFSLEGAINQLKLAFKALTNPAEFGGMLTTAIAEGLILGNENEQRLERTLSLKEQRNELKKEIQDEMRDFVKLGFKESEINRILENNKITENTANEIKNLERQNKRLNDLVMASDEMRFEMITAELASRETEAYKLFQDKGYKLDVDKSKEDFRFYKENNKLIEEQNLKNIQSELDKQTQSLKNLENQSNKPTPLLSTTQSLLPQKTKEDGIINELKETNKLLSTNNIAPLSKSISDLVAEMKKIPKEPKGIQAPVYAPSTSNVTTNNFSSPAGADGWRKRVKEND